MNVPEPLPTALSPRASGAERRASLKTALGGDQAVVLPGAFDALGAVLVEKAGFAACYVTGAGVANTQLAVPDVGVLSFELMATQVSRITAATAVPIVVDIDTGYGGPIMVMRAVREYERLDVSALQIEDQRMPKRCGHFNGKKLVSIEQMQAKIDAAVSARTTQDLLIIARTDARAVDGYQEAIRRARAYQEAGADVLFVEAPESLEELRSIPAELPDIPLVANIVEGGKTPAASVSQLGGWGYSVVLHANLLMRSMVRAGIDTLAHLREQGESETIADRYITWDERQGLVGLDAFDAIEDALAAKWGMER